MGGAYQLLGRIGAGGMAEVFLGAARGEAGFEKQVAIKRILPSMSREPSLTALLLEEARIASRLSHGNIVQVLDLGRAGSDYFLVLEYVDGVDLASLLACARVRGLPPGPALAVHVCRQVLAGLHYVHNRRDEQGHPLHLVHRDVSPANILVSRAGEVKLTDFGIVKARDRAMQTEAGLIRGKAAYMPPEQAAGEPLDHRADLFALGVCLHEMLTGQPLFVGDTPAAVLRRVVALETQPAPPPSSLCQGIPGCLDEAVLRAVAARPEQRHDSARAFDQALAAVQVEADLRASAADVESWLAAVSPPRRVEPLPASGDLLSIGPAPPAPPPAAAGTLPIQDAGGGEEKAASSRAGQGQEPGSTEKGDQAGDSLRVGLGKEAERRGQREMGSPWRWAVLALAALALLSSLAWVGLRWSGFVPGPRPPAPAAVSPPSVPVAAGLAEGGKTLGRSALRAGGLPAAAPPPAPVRTAPIRPATPRPAALPAEGVLFLNSEPWARILVDGKDTGATTPTVEGLRLPAGRHRLTLENAELELGLSVELELQAGQVVKRFFDLRKDGVQK